MKTIFRQLGFAVLFIAAMSMAAFAQDPAPTPDPVCADIDGFNAVYQRVLDNHAKSGLTERETALAAGKELLEKWGACEAHADVIKWVKPQVEKLEKLIKRTKLFNLFDEGIKTEKPDQVYAAGKQILDLYPEDTSRLNVIVQLGLVGYNESYKKNNKYVDDSITYAKIALDKLTGGAKCPNKNGTCGGILTLTKEQALDELPYVIATLTFNQKNDKKRGLALYQDILNGTGKYKTDARIYDSIGSYFATELLSLNGELTKLIDDQKKAATDEEKLKLEEQIKSKIALRNGYAERSMDAIIRAHKNAKTDTPAGKAYKDELYKKLAILYEGRFEKKDGMDAYIASVAAKPMTPPTAEVTPVSDEPATTTTNTTGGAPVTAKPVVTTAPAATTAAKPPTAATATPAAATVSAAKPKTVTKKKPAVRRKRG